MNYLSINLFLLASLFITICNCKSHNYISTTLALEKYGSLYENQSYVVFPDLRENPLKWYDSIPERKLKLPGSKTSFSMTAQPDEYYVYQLGVWAMRKDLQNMQIKFSDFKDERGRIIDTTRMTCFNKGGIDFRGNSFSKRINIPAGRIQALWIGIDLEGIEKGNYTGSVTIAAAEEEQSIPLQFIVAGEIVPNHGYNEDNRLSRLNWLNSTVGIDDEITNGYLPVTIDNYTINILGRTLKIADNGLPSNITSFFGPSNQSLNETGEAIISSPFRFIIEKEDGGIIRFSPGKLNITERTASKVSWSVLNTSKECNLECMGQMEFDGFVDYRLKLTANLPLKVKNIRLEIPVEKDKSEYMMGLGHEGGLRTPDWKWKWDVSKNQDMLWVGGVNGGLRIKLKAENYVRPLVNIYYGFGPLKMPPSWGNDGKGGVDINQKNSDVEINAYSGNREMKTGEQLNYDFELLITPFRLINPQTKFNDRYYHGGGTNTSVKIEEVKRTGANIINIHHAEDIYPFINYPHLDANVGELTQLVANAHSEKLRMKLYYTTRELTKNLPEFWAFNSLNGEVIFPGPGNASRTEALHPDGPNEWLIKNLRENYIPAWYNLVKEGKFKGETDLSVITTPDSRLNNFYVAGLDWMVQNLGIDGVYIDDSALDRNTLQRARKVIDRHRPNGRMDLHSWNHFNEWAGFASCLNLYMDLLPYFDLVWIGEGRDYDRLPDHWLIEVSGIPFGLPGQMLQGGGNPWRGMVYGITNRVGWTKNSPEYLWKFFDEYCVAEREMIGYWDKTCPVHTDNTNLVASVFKGPEDVVIAIGNWSDEKQTGSLEVDWKSLHINPEKCSILVPGINEFQEPAQMTSGESLQIEGGKGIILVVR